MPRHTLRIPYASRDFPSRTRVRSSGNLQTNWNDLLSAALTVGRPNRAHVFQHGKASYHEALFRLSLVRMALEQQKLSSRLHRTEAFRSLDPTEKGAVSYFLGMTVCKLFASRLLGTPWLLHLDVFRDQLDVAVFRGRSRPDLIGRDATGAWHAFESKGRSSVPTTEDRRKAKAQAQRLVSVDSTSCSLHVGAIAYFRQGALEFHWRDPNPDEPDRLDLLSLRLPEDAWRFHYEPALALVAAAEKPSHAETRAAIDVDVEIYPTIHELLLEGAWAAAHSLANELRPILHEHGFHPDGLKVVAGDSWRRECSPGLVDQ